MNDSPLILLADDDIDDRYIFESAIQDINNKCLVYQVEDGEKLIDFINKSDVMPDFIVLDINMPKVNGLDCLKHIRKNDRYKDTNIIMLSTSTNELDVNEAFNNGARLYIRKPHSYAEMKTILAYCLSSGLSDKHKVKLDEFVILESNQLRAM